MVAMTLSTTVAATATAMAAMAVTPPESVGEERRGDISSHSLPCTVFHTLLCLDLLWTPWGSGEVSCIQCNPSIVDTSGTW